MNEEEIRQIRRWHIHDLISKVEDEIRDLIRVIKYKSERLIDFFECRTRSSATQSELYNSFIEIEIQQHSIKSDNRELDELLHTLSVYTHLLDLVPI